MASEHWLNADFDLSLRPRWRGLSPARERQVRELEWHALGLAGPGDSVRLHLHPGDELLELLASSGFDPPPLTVAPAVRADAELVPFGWNAEADGLAHRYRRTAARPALEVVRRVNRRSFGAALERELGDGGWWLAECRSVAELAGALAGARDRPSGWVVKAEHANAGLGNRRLRSRRLEPADLRWAEAVLAEDDLLHLEPWAGRLLDLSSVFTVAPSGEAEAIGVHEVVTTAAGAFVGALHGASMDPDAEGWYEGMVEASRRVAHALASSGYVGPACIDGFVWADRGTPRLRVLADLNARNHVSAGGRAIAQRLAPEAAAYWRFYPARKLRPFGRLGELVAALGDDAYDPARRRGALPTSPVAAGGEGGRRRAAKMAILGLAGSRAEVLALHDRVRRRIER